MAAMCDVPPLPSRVVGDADGPQCQALNLSDSQRCRHAATHNNDLFCKFHAFQCFYMYKGYKRRGAELDALLAREPPFLRNSRVALQNQDFEGVTEESELQEIHGFLFNQYVLLRKVISARRLHHAHFYSLDMDYGHKAYLDHLISREQAVHKALESLERRSAVIIFRKEKWFDWVRKEQEEEEENREMEVKKKLKLEHALFRRHWGDMRARLEAARKKEEKKRQEAYLEEVWRERMAAAGSSESDIDWDPIEDIYRDDRARFTDLIRHFLWMDMAAEAAAELEPEPGETSTPVAEASTPATEASTLAGEAATPAAKKKKRGKRKGKPQSAAPANNADSTKNGSAAQTAQQGEPDKNNIESKEDVKKRLMEGVEKDYDHVQGFMLVGGAELPHELYKKTAPYSEEEAERLVSEIAEVKKLLFCRQLLSQPQLLPAALRANSIEEFLADESLPESGLRDLCLKVEKPSLQALRDACADFIRGDQPDHDEAEIDDLEATPPRSAAEFLAHSMRYGSLEDVGRPGTGLFNDLIGLEARKMFDIRALKTAILSMGPKDRKVKIKVCGKAIWNHASQRSMARDGWLHFSIMAKDCSFPEAMSLCRNWDEFANLHFLAGWQYFPASKWSMWTGNMMMDDLVSRGFVPFYREVTAEAETTYNKLSKLTQKALAACPMVVEARNIICAYMKRNDAASRRFIQYTLMSRGEALILVRDGRTGKIVVAPYENERWRRRYIPGYLAPPPGLQSSDDAPWMRDEVDTQFFDKAQARRKWTFGFDSYYEVYVWDNAPGQDVNNLLRLISESLWKAHRVRGLRGKHKIQKHIMEGLTRDPKTMAVRPIKPGEDVQNLYDEVTGPDATYWVRTNSGKQIQTSEDLPPGEGRSLFYNAADAAEDAILFDESLPDHAPFLEITNPLQMFESNGMSPSVLNYKANLLHKRLRPALGLPERELVPVDDAVSDDDDSDWASSVGSDDRHPKPYAPGSDEFNYYLPPLWAQAHRQIQRGKHSKERKDLLRKLDFAYVTLRIPNSELMTKLGPMEIMERDRSFVFKDTFHLSDLEEGAREKYDVSTKLLRGIQNFVPTTSNLDWVWFCMDNLSWMNLKLHYKSYAPEPLQPWPHRYMAQDITQAFVAMALFFPDLPVASVVHEYLQTEEGSEFKSSPLFNLAERAKYRPTCRTRTSNKFRPNSFWAELDKLTQSSEPICDIYPVEWGIIVRTTIAKLYRGGAVNPSPYSPEPEVCSGITGVATEPGRQPDMYIQYSWEGDFTAGLPANYIDYMEWPDLLTKARPFAAQHPTARFSLIKLWSAPHFYPLMLQPPSRLATAFIDPMSRSWEWKFLPKDMPASEWSIHNTVRLRLGCLRQAMLGVSNEELALAAKKKAEQEDLEKLKTLIQQQQKEKEEEKKNGGTTTTGKNKKDKNVKNKKKGLWERQYDARKKEWNSQEKWKADSKWSYGYCELDDRVFHRGDLILVMGTDQEDLLKWSTAVTFALQTKPWLREVDLWKSFVNVDLEFLERLDRFHLGYEIEEQAMG